MQPAIPSDIVRRESNIVCASAEFARSPRRQKLLPYVLQELLANRLANFREMHRGVHVFGRSAADFGPDTDARPNNDGQVTNRAANTACVVVPLPARLSCALV